MIPFPALFLLKTIYFWLLWVFIAAQGLSLVVVSRGYSLVAGHGFLLLRLPDSRAWASIVVAHGLSYPEARGIFPDQGSNPCPIQGIGRYILNH